MWHSFINKVSLLLLSSSCGRIPSLPLGLPDVDWLKVTETEGVNDSGLHCTGQHQINNMVT